MALALALSAASVSPSLADRVRVSDLELLLRGGVGEAAVLRHVERWGLEDDLRTEDLLALQEAGASADLLEALIGASSPASHATRAELMPGGEALLLTNLDEDGQRLGGEIADSVPYNQMEPASTRYEPPVEPARAAAPAYDAPAAPVGVAPPAGISIGRPYPASYAVPYARYGTPGGYTRYKLFYSRAPYDGFRTWVPPVTLVVGGPVVLSTHTATPYGPSFFSY